MSLIEKAERYKVAFPVSLKEKTELPDPFFLLLLRRSSSLFCPDKRDLFKNWQKESRKFQEEEEVRGAEPGGIVAFCGPYGPGT